MNLPLIRSCSVLLPAVQTISPGVVLSKYNKNKNKKIEERGEESKVSAAAAGRQNNYNYILLLLLFNLINLYIIYT